jgi:hypothetical protein
MNRPHAHAPRARASLLLRTLLGTAALAAIAVPLHAQQTSTTNDPRVGLKAGLYDAGTASKGMQLVAHRNKPDMFHPNEPGGLTYANSDMAFRGKYLYQGNFSGFQIWDISNPLAPTLTEALPCFTEQGDPSIYRNLLFISAEDRGSRLDCAPTGVQDTVSKERMIGIRIYDVSDPKHPRAVANVQTCRGSHTHTIYPDPKDPGIVYVYVSGLAPVRSPNEMAGCEAAGGVTDPNSALFRVEVIRVPVAHPEQAKIVSSARIFNDLVAPATHGVAVGDTANGAGLTAARRMLFRIGLPASTTAADSLRAAQLLEKLMFGTSPTDTERQRVLVDSLHALGATAHLPGGGGNARSGPSQCHDITIYPYEGLAAGACSGYGILLNVKDPVHPVRLQAVSDSNFAFWHSATFTNNASKLLFTDEWGGGTQPKCRATDPIDWGADAIFTLQHDTLHMAGYYKMPAAQTPEENCVAHNGMLVPVPGRDIMVQGWYQGGISVFDFTDAAHPKEIAYFDRGPIDATKMVIGGYWAGYYYNGYIYGSEIARGLDVFKLTPTADLTQNEIDAANLVRFETLNPQSQPHITWPAEFVVARAYVDQLVRDGGLPAARTSAISASLKSAEGMTGAKRKAALKTLAESLEKDAPSSKDATRVKALAELVERIK